MENLLTVENLVALTHWTPGTVYQKASAGKIPGRVKLGHKSLRFKESEIRRWLDTLADSHNDKGAPAPAA